MALKQVVFVLILLSIYRSRAIDSSADDDIGLEEQLKLLNKPAVETFLTEEGDIIDCVDIEKQRALDHPLLKNHKVQRKPNLPLRTSSKTPSSTEYVQIRSRKPCPIGTVPIQRIKKVDLMRIRSLPKNPYGSLFGYGNDPSREHRVTIRDDTPGVLKYGGSAYITVYNLTVAEDESSEHNILISTGPIDRISIIVAGWHVNPSVYGDSLSRLTTYWTGDSWQDGCFNTVCPGFVQVDGAVTPSYPITPVSTHYSGDIRELKIEISQDVESGNWWLRVNDPPIDVGYWPKDLFVNLQDGTFTVAWGGLARESENGYCPPMGDGELPDAHDPKAAYYRQVELIDASGQTSTPSDEMIVEIDAPYSNYDLVDLKHRGEPWDYYFTFGGPGGYCGA